MTLPESIHQGLERGRVRDLLHLGPEDFQIHEIAARLAKINRFCGATDIPFSVAAHSVLVSRLVATPSLRRAALLHDITESFAIGDMITPVKRLLPGFKEIESAIHAQLCVPFPDLDMSAHPCVRHADERAYQLESYYLRGTPPRPEHTCFAFEHPTPEIDHIAAEVGLVTELTWRQARDLFMDEYKELFT